MAKCKLCNQQVTQIDRDMSVSITTYNKRMGWTSHVTGQPIWGTLCYYHEKVRKRLMQPGQTSGRSYFAKLDEA